MRKQTFLERNTMAVIVPETIPSTATAGRRRLYRTLKTYLADDYSVYYEPDIQGRWPVFII